MNYDNIPQRIKDTGQFCTWKYEQRKDRMTKVPYNPMNGQKASVDKPETFADFKTAVNAVSTYSGIGIRVTVAVPRNTEFDVWKVEHNFSCVFFTTYAEAMAYCKGQFFDTDGKGV